MSYDNFVLSDQHARERHQAILREVAAIRLAEQAAPRSPSLPRRVVQPLVTALVVLLQR